MLTWIFASVCVFLCLEYSIWFYRNSDEWLYPHYREPYKTFFVFTLGGMILSIAWPLFFVGLIAFLFDGFLHFFFPLTPEQIKQSYLREGGEFRPFYFFTIGAGKRQGRQNEKSKAIPVLKSIFSYYECVWTPPPKGEWQQP
jgi:hypothetical protein